MMTPRHDRPVALITGAARRVGAVIARTLHAAGYDIALHYRHSAEDARALAGELQASRARSVLLVQADLADLAALPAGVAQVTTHYGRLDALVNNASAFFHTPVDSATPAQWDTLFASNAQAPFFLSQAALPAHHAWLKPALDEYVEEEKGHEEWILDDIRACGGDAEAVRHGRPGHAAEVMVAYAYDTIQRGNPLGFFGMVHVLEGTSVSLALMAADRIQQGLNLPDAAFSYLRSHGTLDQEHTAHFALLMDEITDPKDQADIVHSAKAFFRLYGDVFRGLPLPQMAAQPAREAVA